ncbi:MAG: 2'-5' RNA ligase family protein [Eubacteriales bacterium]
MSKFLKHLPVKLYLCLGGRRWLWSDIEQEMVKQGFAAEQKPFSAHLTLGRVKEIKPAPGLNEILQRLENKKQVIPLTEIKLMRSRLTGSGPEYSCLGSFTLQEHF